MRRTLYSFIKLPSGDLSCPAATLPPMTIITEEVSFGSQDREDVRMHGILMARGLLIQEGDKLANVAPTNPSIATFRRERNINCAAYQAGVLVAHDSRDIILLEGTEEYGEDRDIVHNAFQAIRTAGDLSESNSSRLQKKKKKAKMGVEKVLYLRSMTLIGVWIIYTPNVTTPLLPLLPLFPLCPLCPLFPLLSLLPLLPLLFLLLLLFLIIIYI